MSTPTLRVLDILNNSAELNALPVEGDISVLLSTALDDSIIKDRVFIIRDGSDAISSIQTLSMAIERGDVDLTNYDIIDYTYDMVEGVPTGVVLTVKPTEPLLPASDYYLVLSKYCHAEFHTLNKTNSLGRSEASLVLNGIPVSEEATYEVEVTGQSSLSNGMHIVVFTISKNGLVTEEKTLNIRASTLSLNDYVSITFNPNVPFLVGEKWQVELKAFESSGETKIQKFSTYLTSSDIVSPETNSGRVNNTSLLEFYEKWGRGRTSSAAETSSTGKAETGLAFKFTYPNIIFIESEVDIDPESLTTGINADILYAFGNYHLPSMGLYKEDARYVIKAKLLNPRLLKLTIEYGTYSFENDEKYVIVIEA